VRHILVRALVLLSLILSVGIAWAVSTGPVATRTGARGFFNKPVEPNCHLCHGFNQGEPYDPPLNDPSGSVSILDVPSSYVPGTTYTLRVRLQHDWNPMPEFPLRWGFQMQAIQASTGDSAGIWVLTQNVSPDSFRVRPGLSTSVYKYRRYVEQAGWGPLSDHAGGPTHYGELGPVEWHVRWQAPPGDSGKIYFFAAGNSANGDGISVGSGDYIFTTAESTVAQSAVDVPPHPSTIQLVNSLGEPYPNPMSKCASLDFTITRSGVVDVSVFDLQGRRVRTVIHEYREAGYHGWFWDGRRDDGTYARNGLYFIRLLPPGERRPISQKVTLAR